MLFLVLRLIFLKRCQSRRRTFNRISISPLASEGPVAPTWSSLDALPRIGGLSIEYGDNEHAISRPRSASQGASSAHALECDSLSPRDSPVDRIEIPSFTVGPGEHVSCEHLEVAGHEHEKHETNNYFGYENNFHFLSPNTCNARTPMERNVSQVSGSSSDSGYHGVSKNNKNMKPGLWSHCKCK